MQPARPLEAFKFKTSGLPGLRCWGILSKYVRTFLQLRDLLNWPYKRLLLVANLDGSVYIYFSMCEFHQTDLSSKSFSTYMGFTFSTNRKLDVCKVVLVLCCWNWQYLKIFFILNLMFLTKIMNLKFLNNAIICSGGQWEPLLRITKVLSKL